MQEKKKISWKEFHKGCNIIADKALQHFKPEAIYGIPRGGLIPATIISHYLNVPIIQNISKFDNNVLIVDEIVDSGNTIRKIDSGIWYPEQRNIKFAALFVNELNCEYYPDFFYKKTKNWIVFPYEKEIDTISTITYKNDK